MKKIISYILLISILMITISLVIPAMADTESGIISDKKITECSVTQNDNVSFEEISYNDDYGSYSSVHFTKGQISKRQDEMTESGTADYGSHISVPFTLKKDSTVYIWLRVKVVDGLNVTAGDSVWVSVDQTTGNDYYLSNLRGIENDAFSWFRVYTKELSQGDHTLYLLSREVNLEISHIKIVDNPVTLVWDDSPFNTPEISPKGYNHPRVLVNETTLPKIKKVMANTAEYPDIENFVKVHNNYLKLGKNIVISTLSAEYEVNEWRMIKSLAFDYLVNEDKESGEKAIDFILNRLENVEYTSEEDYSKAGYYIYTAAIVYDWCFDLLEDGEGTQIVEKSLELASVYTEMGWPPVKQSGWGGHGSENSLLRDLLALGIATYDEYPDIYNVSAGRITDEYIGPRKVFFSAHKSLYGTDYGVYRGKHDIACALLFKAIGVDNIWETSDYQYMPYWYIYAERGDGYFLEDGDGRENQAYGRYKRYDPTYMAHGVGSLFSDGYLKAYSDKLLSDRVNSSAFNERMSYEIYGDHVESIIANNYDLEEKDLTELEYSKYFPYPGGAYIARTGWDENSMVVSMKINPLSIADHNHLDAGGFQIYYKGNLATDSGYYQGLSEENALNLSNETGNTYYQNYFGGTYHQAYYRQTIAHNCMLIENTETPDTEFVNGWDAEEKGFSLNKGGQKSNSKGDAVYPDNPEDIITDETLNTSKVLAYGQEEGVQDPDYTYLKGDLSGAYPSDTVSAYERSFMFLNFKNEDIPGALIVFDHVVAKESSYKRTYLLHGVNAPEIDGNRVTLTRSEKDVAPSTTAEGYDYNGKLINDTLLPENATIKKVGETQDDYIISDTVNLRTKYVGTNTSVNEGGGIRTEITDNSNSKMSYFLNVMQVSDADSEVQPLTSTLIDNMDYHYGVEIYDRVVLFGKTKDRISSDISFAISNAGSYNISVADLKDGMWYIYKDGVYKGRTSVSETEGIAYFVGTNGGYTLTMTPAVSVSPDNTSKFYFGLGNYENKNAFMAFGKISGLYEENGTVIDYGMVFEEGITEPELDKGSSHKISVKDKNFTIDSSGNLSFGVKVYGNAILNYKPYSIRTYAITNEDGKETVKYGEVTYDYVRNFGACNSYPLTIFEVNE